jgi:hypothetical protein
MRQTSTLETDLLHTYIHMSIWQSKQGVHRIHRASHPYNFIGRSLHQETFVHSYSCLTYPIGGGDATVLARGARPL